MRITRTIAETRAALARGRRHRPRADDGRLPRGPPRAVPRPPARRATLVVASLFVNPAQFGDPADLAALPARRGGATPRSPRRQASTSSSRRPSEELYPPGYETWVEVERASRGLEGDHRPGHFRGVATVCLKLFNIVRPRRAYFGQKDAQQVEVLRRMIRDLDLELELRVLPTVRDADGLALSSRNALLSPGERAGRARPPRALSPPATRPRRARLLDGARRRLRRGRALRPARPRRRRPRRLRPPDRQRPPRRRPR